MIPGSPVRRRRLARGFMAGLAAGLTIVVLEIPTMLGFDWRPVFNVDVDSTWSGVARGVQRYDPELLVVHKPHTHYVQSVPGNLVEPLRLPHPTLMPVDVAYNRHGFRNDRDLDAADIVVIGDSFVEGAETANAQTMVAQLGNALGTTVANLGQSGYGPQQELVVLRRYGLPLRPKVVVWVFFGGNDLANVDEYEENRTSLANGPLTAPLSERMATVNALIALARLTTPSPTTVSANALLHTVQFTRADGVAETLYLDREDTPGTPNQWEVVLETLQSARDDARKAGAGFLLVYVPRKLNVYRGFVTAPPQNHVHHWPQDVRPARLAQWAADQDVTFLDATNPLREAVRSGEAVYLAEDVHWTPAGHRVVAESVAKRIRSMRGERAE